MGISLEEVRNNQLQVTCADDWVGVVVPNSPMNSWRLARLWIWWRNLPRPRDPLSN